MEIVLTSEQLRQVEELKKKDQVTGSPVGLFALLKPTPSMIALLYVYYRLT